MLKIPFRVFSSFMPFFAISQHVALRHFSRDKSFTVSQTVGIKVATTVKYRTKTPQERPLYVRDGPFTLPDDVLRGHGQRRAF